MGCEVDYNDPYVPLAPKTRKHELDKDSVALTKETLSGYDCVLMATDHSEYDPDFILKNSNLLVDTRNFIKNGNGNGKVVRA